MKIAVLSVLISSIWQLMGYFVVSSHKWVQGDVQPSSYSEVPNLVGWGSNKWTSRLFSAVKQLAHNLKFMHTFTVLLFLFANVVFEEGRGSEIVTWQNQICTSNCVKARPNVQKKTIHICPHAQWERQSSNRTHQNTTAKKKSSAVSKLTWNWNKINPDHWIRT